MLSEKPPSTPWIDNLALSLARLYFRKDRANADEVWRIAQHHSNPLPLSEDFSEGTTILPAGQGFQNRTTRWEVAIINGSARIYPPPHGEAADILIEDHLLKLKVRNDPNFSQKSAKWRKEAPAAEQYNNAYVVGLRGFMPLPAQAILIQCRMKIQPGFHGSTGIWVQESNTFDPQTGIMVKPFRSFGFSYLGEASDAYIRGLAIETVIGLSIQNKKTITEIDPFEWHIYAMRWSWLSPKLQGVEFYLDNQPVGQFDMHPFGPAEIQLWADNYRIGRSLKIGYLNVPEVDETWYDWIRITAESDAAQAVGAG